MDHIGTQLVVRVNECEDKFLDDNGVRSGKWVLSTSNDYNPEIDGDGDIMQFTVRNTDYFYCGLESFADFPFENTCF